MATISAPFFNFVGAALLGVNLGDFDDILVQAAISASETRQRQK
jgi:hypothetical protein